MRAPGVGGVLAYLLAAWALLTACGPGAAEKGKGPADAPTPPFGRDGSPPAGSAKPTAPSPSDCPNQSRVVSDPGLRRPERRSGDVDGDGAPDRVSIALDPQGPIRCQAFLVVETGTLTLAAPIRGLDDFSVTPGLPRLSSLVSIDERPGREVVVDVAAGASTRFVAVFTVDDGTAARVDVTGHGAPPNDIFGFGGSVGRLQAVDCAGDGTVVVSAAVAATPERYRVTRRFYEPSGAIWAGLGARTERTVVSVEALGRVAPEFASSPFLSCR